MFGHRTGKPVLFVFKTNIMIPESVKMSRERVDGSLAFHKLSHISELLDKPESVMKELEAYFRGKSEEDIPKDLDWLYAQYNKIL
jgi:hypothetical protein